jgi:hypothetical protein
VNKKIIQACCLVLIMSVIFTGCSNSLKSQNEALNKELADAKSKVTSLQSANNELQNQLEDEKKKNAKESIIYNKNDIYTIYTANIDTYNKEANSYIYISSDLDLKQKVTAAANALSVGCFSNLPVEVMNIEEVNNKKIAVINLKESDENQGITDMTKLKGKSWALNYLQGSTGGAITSTSLIETFLQREHTGGWIDGVRFLYNGSKCDDNLFQHAPDLTQVSYRK